ncbi:MAG: hypothetical protein AB1782_16960 [Cyanobacteriota bacterium]
MKKTILGSSLSQYAIIIGIIILAIVPVFFLLGQTIKDNFKGFSSTYSDDSGEGSSTATTNDPGTTGSNTTDPGSLAGSLNGTPENPVKQCENGKCIIDYGEFALQGIPDNFTELVETSGTSAGTDNLASMLDQMIAQMEGKVDPAELQQIKDLSNMGHLIADYEKYVEEFARQCDSTADPKACMGDFLYHGTANYTPPSNLTSQFQNLNLDFTNPGNILEIGGSMNSYVNDINTFNSKKDTNLCAAFVNQYLTVADNSSFTNAQKDIVKELYWQIGTMATELDNIIWSSGSSNYTTDSYIDPLTLKETSYDISSFEAGDIYNPKYSNTSDLDSALICAAGYHSDSGIQCH